MTSVPPVAGMTRVVSESGPSVGMGSVFASFFCVGLVDGGLEFEAFR
jgi:hypothetical protein